jgi:hypothetical protein
MKTNHGSLRLVSTALIVSLITISFPGLAYCRSGDFAPAPVYSSSVTAYSNQSFSDLNVPVSMQPTADGTGSCNLYARWVESKKQSWWDRLFSRADGSALDREWYKLRAQVATGGKWADPERAGAEGAGIGSLSGVLGGPAGVLGGAIIGGVIGGAVGLYEDVFNENASQMQLAQQNRLNRMACIANTEKNLGVILVPGANVAESDTSQNPAVYNGPVQSQALPASAPTSAAPAAASDSAYVDDSATYSAVSAN